jgi:hypothetical protein
MERSFYFGCIHDLGFDFIVHHDSLFLPELPHRIRYRLAASVIQKEEAGE